MSAAAATNNLRERISFRQDVPQEVTLEGNGTPTPQEGRDGITEFRYFLQGRKIMWISADAHTRIAQAQAGEGATFAISKHKAPKPWSVVHIEDEPATAQWQPPDQQPAARPAPPAPPARPRQEASAGQPQQAAMPAEAPYSTHMYTALCAALRVAAAAEDFARKNLNRAVAFETADIRAIAATLFIHATGGGR